VAIFYPFAPGLGKGTWQGDLASAVIRVWDRAFGSRPGAANVGGGVAKYDARLVRTARAASASSCPFSA